MKTIHSYTLTLLVLLLSTTFSLAQEFDANRMNRDIKIMENILDEMFKTQPTNASSSGAVATTFFSRSSRNTRGTYMPGYGVIFMVQNQSLPGSISITTEGGYSFYYNSDEKSSDETEVVDEESVKNRINEFLRSYASTIGQLKDNENVIVIYGNKPSSRFNVLRTRAENRDKNVVKRLPVISVSTTKRNLDAYRSGKLSKEQFDQQLTVSTSENKEYLDLNVLKNIFETALKNDEENSFRLYGSINYMMLDNFGVVFNFDVQHGRRSGFFINSGSTNVSEIYFGEVKPRSEKEVKEKENEEADALKEINKAFEDFKTNLVAYMVDYGRTLESINDNQYILLSVNVNGRYEGIPTRLDMQIKKADLKSYDRGQLSRDAAIAKVVVTEY